MVERALTIARFQQENADYHGLPGPGAYQAVGGYDAATDAASPERRAGRVGAICAQAVAAKGLTASGAFTTDSSELAVGNSHGVFAYAPASAAALTAVLMGASGSGYADGAAVAVDAIDPDGRRAQHAVDKAHPQPQPDRHRARRLRRGARRSTPWPRCSTTWASSASARWPCRKGAPSCAWASTITGANISICDDGYDPRGFPMAFDFEGVPKQRVDLIQDGVAHAVVYDSYTAGREPGRASTGHALPAPNTYGPLPLNLIMAAGLHAQGRPDRRASSAGSGSRASTTSTSSTRLQTMLTGMTRDGTFLIENGADHAARQEPALHPERAGRPAPRRARRYAEAAKELLRRHAGPGPAHRGVQLQQRHRVLAPNCVCSVTSRGFHS